MISLGWKLKTLPASRFLDNHSYRSCLNLNATFEAMFPDSQIAKDFSMSKTKMAYLTNFGLVPYYRKNLLDAAKLSPVYSLSFDESLNSIYQEEQMDFYVRFWNDKAGRVAMRYLDSKFLSRPNARNLLEKIQEVSCSLEEENFIQVKFSEPIILSFAKQGY